MPTKLNPINLFRSSWRKKATILEREVVVTKSNCVESIPNHHYLYIALLSMSIHFWKDMQYAYMIILCMGNRYKLSVNITQATKLVNANQLKRIYRCLFVLWCGWLVHMELCLRFWFLPRLYAKQLKNFDIDEGCHFVIRLKLILQVTPKYILYWVFVYFIPTALV